MNKLFFVILLVFTLIPTVSFASTIIESPFSFNSKSNYGTVALNVKAENELECKRFINNFLPLIKNSKNTIPKQSNYCFVFSHSKIENRGSFSYKFSLEKFTEDGWAPAGGHKTRISYSTGNDVSRNFPDYLTDKIVNGRYRITVSSSDPDFNTSTFELIIGN